MMRRGLVLFAVVALVSNAAQAQSGVTARNQAGDSPRASDDSGYVEIPDDKPPEEFFTLTYNPGTPIEGTPGWYDVRAGDDYAADFKREFAASFSDVKMSFPVVFSLGLKEEKAPFPAPEYTVDGATEMDSLRGESPNLPYRAFYVSEGITDSLELKVKDILKEVEVQPASGDDPAEKAYRWSLGWIGKVEPIAITSSLLFELPDSEATDDIEYGIIVPFSEGGDYLSSIDEETDKPIFNPRLRAVYLHKPDDVKVKLSWEPSDALQAWHTPFKARTDGDEYYANGKIASGDELVHKDDTNPIFLEAIKPGTSELKWGIGDKVHTVKVFTCDMAADANRDGTIKFAGNIDAPEPFDVTSKDEPFRFWCNFDNDGTGDGTENIGGTADSADGEIKSKRDLEDFARLHLYLSGLQANIADGTFKVGLKWRNVTGSPGVKVYQAVETDGGTDYLTEEAIAASQIAGQYKTVKADVTGSTAVMLPTSVFANFSEQNPVAHLLFEGSGEGKGQLVVSIHKADGTEIGEGPGVWLDFKAIKDMYERGTANPINMIAPFDRSANFETETASVSTTGGSFQEPFDETSECIIYVHGWNTNVDGSDANSATMFKRLWHRGFKGRFAGFRWDTVIGGASESFHVSEWRGYKFGKSLQDYVTNLRSRLPSSYSINVIAHSLGSAALASAINRGAAIDNCIVTQGALTAQVFDPDAPLRVNPNPFASAPDLAAEGGYRGWLNPSDVNVINFYNEGDQVLTLIWTAVQNGKPHNASGPGHYRFTASTGRSWIEYSDGALPSRDVFDDLESMAFVAIGRADAVGAEGVTGGEIDLEFNLGAGGLNYGGEHSPQFERHIQKEIVPYYNQMLISFDILPNP